MNYTAAQRNYAKESHKVNLPFFSWICTNDLKDCCALAKLYWAWKREDSVTWRHTHPYFKQIWSIC